MHFFLLTGGKGCDEDASLASREASRSWRLEGLPDPQRASLCDPDTQAWESLGGATDWEGLSWRGDRHEGCCRCAKSVYWTPADHRYQDGDFTEIFFCLFLFYYWFKDLLGLRNMYFSRLLNKYTHLVLESRWSRTKPGAECYETQNKMLNIIWSKCLR